MWRFIARRLLVEMSLSLVVIATLTFFLIRLTPGGPFSREKSVSPEVLAQLNSHYGLDKPLYIQYAHYCSNLLHGNLGPSFKYPGRTVNELIANSFPVSLELGIYALVFALCAGILLGLIAAVNHNKLIDRLAVSLSLTGVCVPTFVLGPLLILVFGLWLGWCNVSGWNAPLDRLLPSLTLGIVYTAYIARLTRGGLLDVLMQDFIRTARAKGVPESLVLFRHALRPGLLPVLSYLGPAAAGLITGSFVVETIFAIPGLGRFFVTAAFNRDYTMIMGTVLFYAFIIIVFNTLVDILQALFDPELRSQL